jgi:hypothetical protein
MGEFSVEDVTEDLSISMWVRWESRSCGDSIFIENSKGPKVLELGCVVVGKAEGMISERMLVYGFLN